MAISVVQRTSIDGGYNSGSATYPSAFNSNGATLIFVGVVSSAAPLTGLTYGGVAMTQIGSSVNQPNVNVFVQQFYLLNPPAGTNNFLGSGTATGFLYGEAVGMTGAHATVPIGGNFRGGLSNSVYDVLLTGVTDTANTLFATIVSYYTPAITMSPPSGWTQDNSKLDYASDGWSRSFTKATAGETGTITIPFAMSDYSHASYTAVEIIAAAGGGGSQSVTTTSRVSAVSLGQISMALTRSITTQSLANTTSLGQLAITKTFGVTAQSLLNVGQSLGQPVLTQGMNLTMQGLVNDSALGELGLSLTLTTEGFDAAALLGEIEIYQEGEPQGITLMGTLSSESLGQIDVVIVGLATELTMQGLDSETLMGWPSIPSLQDIELTSIVSLSLVGEIIVSEGQHLFPVGIASGSIVGFVNASGPASFNVASVTSTNLFGRPSIVVGGISISIAGLVSTARLGRPKHQVTSLFPLVLQPGETRTLTGIFTPKAAGLRTGTVGIQTTTGSVYATKTVPVSGVGILSVTVTISDGVLTSDLLVTATISDGVITIGDVSSSSLTAQLTGVSGSSLMGRPSVVSGDAPGMTYLSTQGRLTVDAAGEEVLLRSCNYYGLEQAGVPYGVWTQPYRTITVGGVTTEGMLDKIKRLGFNSIRQLVSVDMTLRDAEGNFFVARTNPQPGAWNSTFVDATLNPDLATLDPMTGYITPINVIAMLDKLVDHCEAIGLRMVLDMHCLAADNSNIDATQGKWYTTATPFASPTTNDRWTRWTEGSRRNETQFIEAWKFYADRYKNRPTVCGFDLINEPHNSTWDRDPNTGLVGIYERVGKEIHAINPNVLLICEGSSTPPENAWNFDPLELTGETTWGCIWSGYLNEVRGMQVGSAEPGVLPNKCVYSPHEYGAEAGPTGPSWFTKPLHGKNFPQNLREVWRQQWGYLAEEDIAPVWIGEFGSTWRVGDHGYTSGQRAKDEQWLERLADYCHTFRIGTAFWGFVPDFIGGLVESNYSTVRTDKLPFVQRFHDPMQPLIEPMPPVGPGGSGGPGGDGGGGVIVGGPTQSIRMVGVAPGSVVGSPTALDGSITWLSADGARLVDESNETVILKSINWFSLEQANYLRGAQSAPLTTRKILTNVDTLVTGLTVGDEYEVEGILNKIKAAGFNSIRFPISLYTLMNQYSGQEEYMGGFGGFEPWVNPEFFRGYVKTTPVTFPPVFNKSTWGAYTSDPPWYDGSPGARQPQVGGLDVLDVLVDHCEALGLRIILDLHCLARDSNNEKGNGGKWFTTATRLAAGTNGTGNFDSGERRNETQTIAGWVFLANRYAGRPTVAAFDIVNEPFHATWDAGQANLETNIRAFYERVGNAIHAVNPDVFLWLEGIHGAAWVSGTYQSYVSATFPELPNNGDLGLGYSENLIGVAANPVVLNTPNKHGYSPHEYGPSMNQGIGNVVKAQALANSMTETQVWDIRRRRCWGYLVENNIAPVYVGEYGALFFNDRPSNVAAGMTADLEGRDVVWMNSMAAYCSAHNVSHAWWCTNPYNADGGGLGMFGGTDFGGYTNIDAPKLAKISAMLTP